MNSKLSHFFLSRNFQSRARAFGRKLGDCKTVQTQKFQEIQKSLEDCPWIEDMRHDSSITSYDFYKSALDRVRAEKNSWVRRWVPTSGSTDERKWIPYSRNFIKDISSSAALLMNEVYLQSPGTRVGRHYWSLSWLPTELRGLTSNDDFKILPMWQQWIFGSIRAVPPSLELAPTSEAAWTILLVQLMNCQDLSFVSVWSPTYWTRVCDDLYSRREEIFEILKSGIWAFDFLEVPKLVRPLPNINLSKVDFLNETWPNLAAMSLWKSSTSKQYAEQLREIFPKVTFLAKGLWATEGVVTIPYEGKLPLAIDCHYYEFLCLNSQRILPAWKLEKHQIVQPLLWTSGGLMRYGLSDRLQVTDFIGNTPCFEFLGRLGGIDLVGEKLDQVQLEGIIAKINQNLGTAAHSVIADKKNRRYFLALSERELDASILQKAGLQFESELLRSHHYRLARELGQLQAAGVEVFSSLDAFLKGLPRADILGQQKVETIYIR